MMQMVRLMVDLRGTEKISQLSGFLSQKMASTILLKQLEEGVPLLDGDDG